MIDTEKNDDVTQDKKGLHAKPVSLIAQVIASIWITAWSAAGFIAKINAGEAIPATDIILTGVAIPACYSPVFLNLIIDKIVKKAGE